MLKRALVTGGSGAIGMAICRDLAAQGMHVIVHANTRSDAATALARELAVKVGSAEAVQFDLRDGDATSAALVRVLEAGPVQVLVNNAGIIDDAPLAGMSEAQWLSVIDVSLNGFYRATQPLLLPMLRTRWGRIVNISSVAASIGNRGQTNYAAAKAGLHGATRALALEVAKRGVTVNTVAPGIIASPVIERSFDAERIRALVPAERAGTPEDVAALVGFLVSDRAGYVTGQLIGVNGGFG
ncbi:MAG: 3-oxoacyl-ACP reductase FabG [Casimicrobiaceae bacterium]